MYWADTDVGLPYLLEKLKEFHQRYPTSSYFEPSKLLQECVAMNVTVQEYYKRGKRSKL